MTKVSEHYDAVAQDYHRHYNREHLETLEVYPANYFRQQIMLHTFMRRGARRVLDVGMGDGSPMINLSRAGVEVWGMDISQKMVERTRQNLAAQGLPVDRVQWGDISDPATYADLLSGGPFDGLMAMGVLPHVENDVHTLSNMAACLKPGGVAFIEFRNQLFSLFTFNRITHQFIVEELLAGLDEGYKAKVSLALEPLLRMDLPPVREQAPGGQGPGYDLILSRFHNPLTVGDIFARAGLADLRFHWYHYHPAPPLLEGLAPQAFRRQAMALEHEPSGWRGMFLCSAFVVEATRE
jgi:2-polyprenyl-3-methyl-5-hydroxy-6-metoxy-1,4-benzoquinol methylase